VPSPLTLLPLFPLPLSLSVTSFLLDLSALTFSPSSALITSFPPFDPHLFFPGTPVPFEFPSPPTRLFYSAFGTKSVSLPRSLFSVNTRRDYLLYRFFNSCSRCTFPDFRLRCALFCRYSVQLGCGFLCPRTAPLIYLLSYFSFQIFPILPSPIPIFVPTFSLGRLSQWRLPFLLFFSGVSGCDLLLARSVVFLGSLLLSLFRSDYFDAYFVILVGTSVLICACFLSPSVARCPRTFFFVCRNNLRAVHVLPLRLRPIRWCPRAGLTLPDFSAFSVLYHFTSVLVRGIFL